MIADLNQRVSGVPDLMTRPAEVRTLVSRFSSGILTDHMTLWRATAAPYFLTELFADIYGRE